MKKTVIGGFLITFSLLVLLIANEAAGGIGYLVLFWLLLIPGNIFFWWGVYDCVFYKE